MKTLVVYDSVYGNTETIAQAIGEATGDDTRLVKAADAVLSDLEGIGLLIVGSPTYGGRPTQPMQGFLRQIAGASLTDVKIACFDTRVPAMWVKLFGFASGKIEKSLKKLGGTPAVNPEGFFVSGTQGPLVDNEIKRAGEWARSIISASG